MSASTLTVYLANTQPNGDAATRTAIQAASLSEAKPTNTGSLDSLTIVVKSSDLASAWSPMDLAAHVSVLKPDAEVAVHVLDDNVDKKNNADLQAIHTAFLLAGLAASSERRESGLRVLSARKKPQGGESQTAALKNTNIVKMDLVDEADDLIDEDNLLADASLEPPPAMSAAATKDDCGGRKPCDNCTCGRADAETKSDQPTVKKSSCGKCHLGDAFRCASCPYLGKPAFRPGEEHLVLDLTDDL